MSERHISTRQMLLLIFAIALALNFAWEMLQMFAYAPISQSQLKMWLFCGLAAVGDALYISLLYWLGRRLTHDQNWISHLSWKRVLAVVVLGIISAWIVERIALGLGAWRYDAEMIIVPVLGAGLLPVIQLSFLPLVTFWIARRLASSASGFTG